MKKRKLVVSLFLIAAVALIGIGYSAVSKIYETVGKLQGGVNENNLDVHFVADASHNDLTDVDGLAPVVAFGTVTYTDQSVNFNISNFSTDGDKAVVYFLVENSSTDLTFDARLSVPTITVSPTSADATGSGTNRFVGDHFEIKASYVTGTFGTIASETGYLEDAGTAVIEAGGATIWLKVEIEMTAGVYDTFAEHAVTVNFNATAFTK